LIAPPVVEGKLTVRKIKPAVFFNTHLHTKRSSIQSDIYQMSYWYN